MKLPCFPLVFLLGLLASGGIPTVRGQLAAPTVATAPPQVSTGIVGPSAPYNDLILKQIDEMPSRGGYSASRLAAQRLSAAALLDSGGITVEAGQAVPSYCSGATYLVFLKAVSELNRQRAVTLDERAMRALMIAGQRDGQGIWGRWNSNGPGTARLFYEMGLGRNFSDYSQARPGDFMKIFWSDAIGKREHGHSVIFIAEVMVNGVESVRFWSSNVGEGYGYKTVAKSKIKAAIFSRLTAPRNLSKAFAIETLTDPYLASLLSKDSSLDEAREKCGM